MLFTEPGRQANSSQAPTFLDVNNAKTAQEAAVMLYKLGFTPIRVEGKLPKVGTEWEKTKYSNEEEVKVPFTYWDGNVGVITTGYVMLGNNSQETLDAFRAECPFYDETLQRMGKNPYPCSIFKRTDTVPFPKTKITRDTEIVVDGKPETKRTTLCDLWTDNSQFVAWGWHPDDKSVRYQFLNNNPIMPVSDAYIKELVAKVAKRIGVKNPYENEVTEGEKKERNPDNIFMKVKDKVKMSQVIDTSKGSKESNTRIRIRCPLHTQSPTSNDSAVIYDDKTIHCHSNGCHGDVISVYASINRLGQFESAMALAEKFGVEYITIPKAGAKFEEKVEGGGIRKRIYLPQEGKLYSEFAQELGDHYGVKEELFFRPALNSVVKLEMQYIEAKQREKRVLQFQEVKDNVFITYIEREFETGIIKKSKESGEKYFARKSMTKGMADITLASEYQFKSMLPIIDKIYNIPMPSLQDGNLVFPKSGYDKTMHSWMPHNAPKLDPTMSVTDAKAIINKIYKDFCFTKEQDRINAISGGLTPMCRGLYNSETTRTPIYFFKATRERSGKDYCSGITGVLYEDTAIEEPPISTDEGVNDDEFRKKILANFKAGRNRIRSSNNKGYLNSSVLESVSTSFYWKDRQLGINEMLTFPNTLEISLSANVGISYASDLSARCIFVNLSFFEEDPNKRIFTIPDLHGWIREHKSEVLSAFYALIRNWHELGMPAGKEPFTTYPEWARVVGGIMEAAGYSSPCVPNDDMDNTGGDAEKNNMRRLYELGKLTWNDKWVTKKDIVEQILNSNSNFSELFPYLNWDKNQRGAKMSFGKIMTKFENRVINKIRMEVLDASHADRKKYRWVPESGRMVGLVLIPNPPRIELRVV